MNTTTKRFSRNLSDAFPEERFNWADRAVMRAVVPDIDSKPAEFDPPRWPFEAASACSEFGHEDPKPQPRLTLAQIIKRKLRAMAIKRMKP